MGYLREKGLKDHVKRGDWRGEFGGQFRKRLARVTREREEERRASRDKMPDERWQMEEEERRLKEGLEESIGKLGPC